MYTSSHASCMAAPDQLDKLEFGGESPLTMRARCSAFRYCPNPLGIVPAEQFDKLEFVMLLSAVIYLIVVRVQELSYL